jgi:DNA primase
MIDFETINRAALPVLPAILNRLVPGGKILGREYTALNPTRADRRPGSFKVNLRTGRWSDFATGDKGGDPVSLCAYVEGVSQAEAARRLARMLGLDTREGGRHG